MNRSTFALFVALLIHLLLMLVFWILGTISPDIKKEQKPKENKIKISLKEMPKVDKKSGLTKEKIKPSPIAPPMPKGSQLKKIVKQPPVKYEPSQPVKTPTLNKKPTPTKPKPKPKPKVEPLPPTKPYIPLLAKKPDVNITKKPKEKTKPKDNMSWIYEDKSAQEEKKIKSKTKSGVDISQNINKLYGSEFGKFTKGQQDYILNNLEIIVRLTYPVFFRQLEVTPLENLNLKVNRNNMIEFYLHPNGDMTDFKFIHSSGVFQLDDVSENTIRYSYGKYPKPKEKTLLRVMFSYNYL